MLLLFNILYIIGNGLVKGFVMLGTIQNYSFSGLIFKCVLLATTNSLIFQS